MSLPEPNWERLGCRMIHKICPVKDTHATMTAEHCPQCGLSPDDVRRFIVGDEGKLAARKRTEPKA
jgi:hypothetical protein